MLRGWLPIIIAIFLALGAGFLSWMAIENSRNEATRGWQLEEVLAAREDIPAGTIITEDLIQNIPMPKQFIYESIMVPADIDFALKKEAIVPLKAGEPIHWYQLRGLQEHEKLSDLVRRGFRAVTINTNADSSVGHWIRPNDSVDIIGIFQDPIKREPVALTLLQNIPVLATGKTSAMLGSQYDEEYMTLTLQTLPQEAEIIILAQSLGTLHLTLRNREDQGLIDRTRSTLDTMFTDSELRSLEEKRNKTIEIIRGLQDKIPDHR